MCKKPRARTSASALQRHGHLHDHCDKCTRRCRSATSGHGRPPARADEPSNLAKTIAALSSSTGITTSTRRPARRRRRPLRRVHRQSRDVAATRIEILTPDFLGRMDRALEILKPTPHVRHNLETVRASTRSPPAPLRLRLTCSSAKDSRRRPTKSGRFSASSRPTTRLQVIATCSRTASTADHRRTSRRAATTCGAPQRHPDTFRCSRRSPAWASARGRRAMVRAVPRDQQLRTRASALGSAAGRHRPLSTSPFTSSHSTTVERRHRRTRE